MVAMQYEISNSKARRFALEFYERLGQAKAVDSAVQKGRHRISQANTSHVSVDIRDTGTGIREDQLPYVFDPFYTTKPPNQGVGLGLSIVHSIVKTHGGSIDITNNPTGGTRVVISLPLKSDLSSD